MSDELCPLLSVKDVRYGFAPGQDFLGPVNVDIRAGECWGIVGPNGAGKSTLLRLMAGLLAPRAGGIFIRGVPLSSLTGKSRGQEIAYVPQQPPHQLDLSVRDVVLMGRFPYRSMGLFDSAEDAAIAEHAMSETAVLSQADRRVDTLSGGEAQRVHLAAALAQQPSVLLLDEPTSSLDLHHQLSIFEILRDRALSRHLAVVVVTHDVNLAFRFCTHSIVLADGKVASSGSPVDALRPGRLSAVYGVTMALAEVPGMPGHRWVVALDERAESQPC